MGIGHLSPYSSRLAPNSCLFVAEDFLADIEGVVKKMLSMAKRNQTVRKKLLTWTRKYPPISGKFESGRI